jgi:hypothetical protein
MPVVEGASFVLGEFIGGPLMIVLIAILFRLFLKQQLVDEARAEADKGRLGSMEGHAEMDMSLELGRSRRVGLVGLGWRRLLLGREPFPGQAHLRPVATGCDRWAP